jgi:hypothetical protein
VARTEEAENREVANRVAVAEASVAAITTLLRNDMTSSATSDPHWRTQALRELLALLDRFDPSTWSLGQLEGQLREYLPHLIGSPEALISLLEASAIHLDEIYAIALDRGAPQGRDIQSMNEAHEVVQELRTQVVQELERLV